MGIALAGMDPLARLVLGEPISGDDFWRICQENPDLRLERSAAGELLIMSPSGLETGGLELDVAAELRQWSLHDGRGKAFGTSAGVTLVDGSIRAADACWISWYRLNQLTPQQRKRFALITPEFVIEVRSPSDGLTNLREKMGEWIANGVELAWLIDPTTRSVEVFRPTGVSEIQEGQSGAYGEGPVSGFVLELARIWGQFSFRTEPA